MITDYFQTFNLQPKQIQPNSKFNENTTLRMVTFNIQTMDNIHRMHELVRKCRDSQIHIVTFQGTCWGITNTWTIGQYQVYHFGKQPGSSHKHAGIMTMVHQSLLKDRVVNEYNIDQGRVSALRIHDRHVDITIVNAYIPTEESNSSAPTWKKLDQFLCKLPKRTTTIIGIDSNAHIKMDQTTPHWSKQNHEGMHTKTNKNGEALTMMLIKHNMHLANTRTKHKNWTKQAPDGKSQSLIDFIIVPSSIQNTLGSVHGPDYDDELGFRRECTAIDHLPVRADIKVPYKWTKNPPRETPAWDSRLLAKAAQEWEQERRNKMMKNPKETNADLISLANQLREQIQLNLQTQGITKHDLQDYTTTDIDDLASKLETTTNEALQQIFPYASNQQAKQDYIKKSEWDMILQRQTSWKEIIQASRSTSIKRLGIQQIFNMLKRYAKWRKQHRQTNAAVRQAKRKHIDELIEKANEGEGQLAERAKHAIIRRLAPKPQTRPQTLKNSKGEYAHSSEQEQLIYDDLVKQTWKGTRTESWEEVTNTNKTPLTLHVTSPYVNAAFRRCKTGKAMRKGTRPAEALHIAGDIIAESEVQLWKAVAYQRRMPDRWVISDVVMIPKPGKDPSDLNNRRGINKVDSGLKAFSSYVQRQTSPNLQKDSQCEWGGLKHKSIRQPLLIVNMLIHRAKRAKMDLAIFSGDIKKAFDSADHEKLDEAVCQFVTDPVFAGLIMDRHENIQFRFQLHDLTEVTYRIAQGAVQGCSLGPMAFTLYYRAYLHYLRTKRTRKQHDNMTFRTSIHALHTAINDDPSNANCGIAKDLVQPEAPTWLKATNSGTLTFVDDHLEIWAIRNAGELRSVFKPFIDAQQQYNLETNFNKTQIAIVPRGKQSVKRLKSYGGSFRIHKGESVRLTKKITYLGTIIDTNGSSRSAIINRVRAAQKAHKRLTPRLYRSSKYTIQQKISIYKLHEVTTLLSGLDTMAMNKGDLEVLERYQNRCIRHITKSPAHIDHVTNADIRKQHDVPTIASMLRKQRLNFLKDIYQHPEENQQVLAVMHGTCEWEATIPSSSNNPIIKQLNGDMQALWYGVHKDGLFFNSPPPVTWSTDYINPSMQKWLVGRSPEQIKSVLSYTDDREETRKARSGCTVTIDQTDHKCSTCGVCFTNACSLAVHKVRKHGEQNRARAQVHDDKCPGCDKVFSNRINAQRHWQAQICVHNRTAIRTIEQVAEQQTRSSGAHDERQDSHIARSLLDYFRSAASIH